MQDAWAIAPNLELTAGLRYERLAQAHTPAYSAPIFTEYGVRTDASLDGADLWMPRLGVRYSGLSRTVISGGVGLFAGGEPKVWISNAFQPPVVFARLAEAEGVTPFSVPAALLDRVAAGVALPVDTIAEDFDTPSDWKASVRVERSFDLPGAGRDFWPRSSTCTHARSAVSCGGTSPIPALRALNRWARRRTGARFMRISTPSGI